MFFLNKNKKTAKCELFIEKKIIIKRVEFWHFKDSCKAHHLKVESSTSNFYLT